jgi:CO/xanthine dehydrogenase FAD-binding subunit
MKPPPFEYHKPATLEEALTIKANFGEDAKVLAGGQSLIPTMNYRLVQPSVLIDLNGLSELDHISVDKNGDLHIGAMTRQRKVEFDSAIEKAAPLLHETIPHIAHPQIRNRGTVGGSLVHADPASELPVVALVSGARFRVKNLHGERWIPSEKFFIGMFMTDLQAEEILVEIHIPALQSGTGWSFMEVTRRKGDYAMMGVGVIVTLDGESRCKNARLVYLNAGDGPVEAKQATNLLKDEHYSEAVVESAAVEASKNAIDPFGSVHATVEYQRHLAYVLTKRAVKLAFERAQKSVV